MVIIKVDPKIVDFFICGVLLSNSFWSLYIVTVFCGVSSSISFDVGDGFIVWNGWPLIFDWFAEFSVWSGGLSAIFCFIVQWY